MEYEWYFSIDPYDFALSYLRWIFSQVSGSTHDSRSYKNSFEYTVKRRIQERRVSCRYIYMLNSISRISSISVCSPHSLALLCSFSKTSTSIRSGGEMFLASWQECLLAQMGNSFNRQHTKLKSFSHRPPTTQEAFYKSLFWENRWGCLVQSYAFNVEKAKSELDSSVASMIPDMAYQFLIPVGSLVCLWLEGYPSSHIVWLGISQSLHWWA